MKYKTLFHLDVNNALLIQMVLNNIKNLRADSGPQNVEVELVVNGDGVVGFTRNSAHREQIGMLASQGVRFAMCGNSLRGLGIAESDLLEETHVVPAGVGELVRKQTEGWAYIRP